jgi:hypothetical protein
MIGLLCFVLAVLASPFKSKLRLEAENAVFRHQLNVVRRRLPGRVRLTNNDRWFLIQLYRWFPSILQVPTIIRPETHAGAEHIDKAVHDPRRIAPIRQHPGQIVGQTETPLGHRQKHHAPVRGQATAIEGSCDFLGVNGWKREWQNRIIGHGGRGVHG